MSEIKHACILVEVDIVHIRTDERCLEETQHVGRGDVARTIVLRPSVVAKVVGRTHIAKVNGRSKSFKEIDISIEADVQAVEVVFASCGLTIGITQREVVHSDIVTTLNADFIVLSKGCAIKVFLPVNILVVHVVEAVALRVLDEERNIHGRTDKFIIVSSTQQLGSITAELTGVHHLNT